MDSKKTYEGASLKVETWCKIGYFIMSVVTPICWIFPRVLFNYFNYFSTNIGNEAFDLPLLMWY